MTANSDEYEQLQKQISQVRAEGLSPDEEKELDLLVSQVDVAFEKLRGAQEATEKEFFELVGRAISLWDAVESMLIAVAGLLLRSSLKKVGVTLYSIQNFHIWLNIIDELFSIDAHLGEFRSRWSDISDSLRSLNDTRVRLAHHTFFHEQQDPNNPTLRPGQFDTRRKSTKYQPLEMIQIVEFMEALLKTMEPLRTLMNQMRERLSALRGKPSPQPAGLLQGDAQ